MNKIYFEAQVYNMYSEDFEFLQDSLVSEVAKLYRQTIEPLTTSALIEGFSVAVDAGLITDPVNTNITYSTINITHPSGWGSFVTKSGIIVETKESAHLLKLASYNPGVKNYIMAKYYTILGSYDRLNKVINENAATALDLSNYTLVQDRELDKGSIVVYSTDDYEKLTADQLADMVLLGVVTSPGTNVLIPPENVDITGRVYVAPRITDGTITVDKLDPSTKIPQSYVDATPSADINDHYDNILTPTNLIDDLNKLRTLIRQITGSATWDSVPGGTLTNLDNQLTKLHIQGVLPDEINTTVLVPTIAQNEGEAAVVDVTPGKVLNEGKIYSQATVLTLDLPPFIKNANVVDPNNVDWTLYDYANTLRQDAGLFLQSQEYDLAVIFNNSSIAGQDLNITLYPQFVINPVGFAVRQIKTDGTIVTFDEGPTGDYVLSADLGKITFTATTDIPSNAVIRLYFDYGYRRYDAIDIVDGAIQITVGRPAARTNPIPAPVPAKGYRLATILRHPFKQDYIYYNPITKYHEGNLVYQCLTNLYPSRECIEINNDVATTAVKPYLQNRITYFTNEVFPAGQLKEPEIPGNVGSSWAINTNSEDIPFARTMTATSFFVTEFYAKNNDELWVRATRNASAGSIRVDWEKTPGINTATNFVFNPADTANIGSVTIDLSTTATDGTFEDIIIPVTRGLSEGFHKVKVTSLNPNTVDIYGIVYGKLDIHYQRNNILSDTIYTSKIVIDGSAPTNKDTGALVIQGGAGIEQNLFVNTTQIVGTSIQLNVQGTGDRISTVEFHSAGSDTTPEAEISRNIGSNGAFNIVNSGTGSINIVGDSGTFINLGNGVNNPVHISSSTPTTAVGTGALVVTGGGSFGENVYAGGDFVGSAYFISTQGFSFISETGRDSGMFWVSENRIQLKSNNIARLELNNGLMIPMGSQTAAAGAYLWVE